jgi:two-component system LytT family sensor kinase
MRLRWLGVAIAAWTALALITASQGYISSLHRGQPQSWAATLGYTSAFYAVWAALTLPVAWLARRVPLEPGRIKRFVAVHAPAGVAVAILHAWLFAVVFYPLYGRPDRGWVALWNSMLLGSFHTNVVLYAIVAVGVAGSALYRRVRDRRLREAELEARLSRAELSTLRAQLQPHFLFNTLNAISALVRDDPHQAEQLIARLGELLRMSLAGDGSEEVPLAGELDLVDAYLDIEHARLGDRLHVDRAIDPAALALAVPHLVLVPLVENAIRYAIAPRETGGRIAITARVHADRLHLDISDDGDAGTPPATGLGIGLANTRARLEHLYAEAHTFEVRTAPGRGFAVHIELPARPHVQLRNLE